MASLTASPRSRIGQQALLQTPACWLEVPHDATCCAPTFNSALGTAPPHGETGTARTPLRSLYGNRCPLSAGWSALQGTEGRHCSTQQQYISSIVTSIMKTKASLELSII